VRVGCEVDRADGPADEYGAGERIVVAGERLGDPGSDPVRERRPELARVPGDPVAVAAADPVRPVLTDEDPGGER
jgi:hypothetical protein